MPVFADHRSLLAATEPDIAMVATPPHTHMTIGADALRAGAGVLLEKLPVLCEAEHRAPQDVAPRASLRTGFDYGHG